jgi:hypothetical protein
LPEAAGRHVLQRHRKQPERAGVAARDIAWDAPGRQHNRLAGSITLKTAEGVRSQESGVLGFAIPALLTHRVIANSLISVMQNFVFQYSDS